MSPWTAFFLGAPIWGCLGILGASLCCAASRADRGYEAFERGQDDRYRKGAPDLPDWWDDERMGDMGPWTPERRDRGWS